MTERPLLRRVAGRTTGPYAPAKLRPLVRDGRIGPLDRFSYDGATWAPVHDFPELLREPPRAEPIIEPLDGGDDIGMPDDFPPVVPIPDEDDESARRLLKVVYWIVGVGGGLIALFLLLTVLTAIHDAGQVEGPVPAEPAAVAPPPHEAADSEQDGTPAVTEPDDSSGRDDGAVSTE